MRETHEIIASKVGFRLKQLRALRTQAQFAAELGLSQAQYNRYETGKRLAPDRVLEKAAHLCGITVEQIVWENGPPGTDDLGAQVTTLVDMLAGKDVEDLYFFLKNKVEQAAKRQRSQASKALEALRTRVG